MNFLDKITEYRDLERKVLQDLDLNAVNTVMNVLEEARKADRHIFICGNGGSAATAGHYAADFNKGVNSVFLDLDEHTNAAETVSEQHLYNFVCLSDNVSTMTAVANDISYAEVFRYPLRVKMRAGDIVIGISGSGNSVNVVNAFSYAHDHGGTTIAIVGFDGGQMKQMSDYCIHVDINDMQISEDIHMILDHMMMWVLTHELGVKA